MNGPTELAGLLRILGQEKDMDEQNQAPQPQQAAPAYSIDADPQGIRAHVCDAIRGVLAFGAEGVRPPPDGHWLGEFWHKARGEREFHAKQAAPAPQPVGLTQAQRIRLWNNSPQLHGDVVGRDAFERLVKFIEEVHRIGIPAPQATSKESGNG